MRNSQVNNWKLNPNSMWWKSPKITIIIMIIMIGIEKTRILITSIGSMKTKGTMKKKLMMSKTVNQQLQTTQPLQTAQTAQTTQTTQITQITQITQTAQTHQTHPLHPSGTKTSLWASSCPHKLHTTFRRTQSNTPTLTTPITTGIERTKIPTTSSGTTRTKATMKMAMMILNLNLYSGTIKGNNRGNKGILGGRGSVGLHVSDLICL